MRAGRFQMGERVAGFDVPMRISGVGHDPVARTEERVPKVFGATSARSIRTSGGMRRAAWSRFLDPFLRKGTAEWQSGTSRLARHPWPICFALFIRAQHCRSE
jgi:hypothetical protein